MNSIQQKNNSFDQMISTLSRRIEGAFLLIEAEGNRESNAQIFKKIDAALSKVAPIPAVM